MLENQKQNFLLDQQKCNLHPLQVTALGIADSLNTRVVTTAIQEWIRQEGECRGCAYIPNSEIFSSVLYEYTLWKIRYHRVHYGPLEEKQAALKRWGGFDKVHLNLDHAACRLSDIWPCPSCMARFNPTGRKKTRYGNGRRDSRW